MKIYSKIGDLRGELAEHVRKGWTIGLIPTMGFLHEGHLNLVRRSRKENLITVVSIFVNPTQFGPNEDFDRYPRDLQRDETLLKEEDVDYIFCPTVAEMYPNGFCSKISLSGITERLCGAQRPGHFDGVATVVAKLLSIVEPTTAYFGLKDYQQYLVISQLVKDLNLPYSITGVPIVREHDGLAMSSRNVYLKPEQRDAALSLYKSFGVVEKMLASGVSSVAEIISEVKKFIISFGNTIDYIELVNPSTLLPVTSALEPFMCMLAVKVDNTRLIDNMLFNAKHHSFT